MASSFRASTQRRREPQHRRRRPSATSRFEAETQDHHLYGLHPVAAALRNPQRRRHRMLATANARRRLAAMGAQPDVPVEEVAAAHLSRLLGGDAVHQGCLLYCDPLPERELEDLTGASRLVVLDQVSDPHNVGAVLRSAAAFAVDAVIVTARHSPAETPVLAKAAAGALELVPVLRVRNLSDTLISLNNRAVATIGLDPDSGRALEEIALSQPFALVLGAEGRGLRQRTRQSCGILAAIDLPGDMPSLNVSNAAALSLYIADRATRRAGFDHPV